MKISMMVLKLFHSNYNILQKVTNNVILLVVTQVNVAAPTNKCSNPFFQQNVLHATVDKNSSSASIKVDGVGSIPTSQRRHDDVHIADAES